MKVIHIGKIGNETRIDVRGWVTDKAYQGSGTVWHDVVTGRRPGALKESRLSEIEWLWKREQGSQ